MSTPTLPPTPVAAPVPSGGVTTAPVLPGSSAYMDRQVAELLALEKQFPETDLDGQYADARWFDEQTGAGALEAYRGKVVAVYNGAIVGSCTEDSLQLEIDLARRYGVHPGRFIIVFVPPRGWRI